MESEHGSRVRRAAMLVAVLLSGLAPADPAPDANTIIRRSTEANRADWAAAAKYDYVERVRDDDGSRTYDVTMVLGTRYKRLIAINGSPLSADGQQEEARKLAEELDKRQHESPRERAERLDEYSKDRQRAHEIIDEMPKAFDYRLRGTRQAGGRRVYVLQATPHAGYEPPTIASAVLTGMHGEFWIDAASFHWVQATAWTVRPVSIAGIMARVEAGTEFDVEQMPLGDGVWLPRRYQIRSRSRILWLFHHHIHEEHTYSHYRRVD